MTTPTAINSSSPHGANARGSEVERRLAVIAGGGRLPREVALGARRAGRDVSVVRLTQFCDDPFADFPHTDANIGALGHVFRWLKSNRVDDVVLVGSVTRGSTSRLGPDLGFWLRLPRIVSLMRGGDDALLRAVIGLLEREGFRVVGSDDVVPELLAPAGPLSAATPTKQHLADIRLGSDLLTTMAPFDVGQSVAIRNGHVLAVEAAEGTEQLLTRVESLRNTTPKTASGVLVKAAKQGQELRIDRPTIGPATPAAIAKAGLAGIAIEAGAVQVIHATQTRQAADDHGVFLYGFTAEQLRG